MKLKPSQIERNPVGLPTVAAEKVSGMLDKLVASLSVQCHQYLKRHWLAEGPEHRDLHQFYEKHYREVLDELDTIAERITTLGSVPTCGLRAQQNLAFLEAEDEGSFPVREMMTRDLENEQSLMEFMREAIKVCVNLSDFTTETMLKQALVRAEGRAHDQDHYLAMDSLCKPMS